MSQSLAKAIKYIKAPDELLATLRRGSLTGDLVVPNTVFTGAQTVKYQSISFESSTLGTYSTSTGYTQSTIVSVWKDLILSQDMGNALIIDKFEDEEAMANGLVTYVNRYILDVQAKAVDIYRFGVITAKTGVINNTVTLTNSTALNEVLKAQAVMVDNNINISDMILYLNPQIDKIIAEQSFGKGYITIGTWGNNIDTQVRMFNGAKMVVIPSDRLGSGIQFILLHKNAVACFEKFRETVYFEEIPGFGGRKAEADIGIYHDAFVYDELVNAVYVSKCATHTVSFTDGLETATPTTMTAITVNEGSSIKIPTCTMVVSGKHCIGWDTDVSGDAVVYAQNAILTMSTAAVTLYAVWEADA